MVTPTMTKQGLDFRGLRGWVRLAPMIPLLLCSTAMAVPRQVDIAVTVDDSPVATRSLNEAMVQAKDNPARTADLLASLLDEYGIRLAETERPGRFASVRDEAIRILRSDATVLAAWRREVSANATRLLETGNPGEAFDRRPLTDAGLESGLRLAQMAIESGSPLAGLTMLDDLESWPGAADGRRRLLVLRGLGCVAALRRDPAARDRVDLVATLEGVLGELATVDEEAEAMIRRIGATPDPGVRRPIPSLASIRDADWTRIWEEPLLDTLYRRRYYDSVDGRAFSESNASRARLAGSSMTTVPAVHGDLVLVNEGFLIRGFDRYTGRMRWFRDFGVSRGMRPSGTPGDLGEIVIEGGAAFTVVGHAFGAGREGAGEILRFDPETGLERWRIQPPRLFEDGSLDGSFISGPPLPLGDIVAIPLRKSNTRLETIEYVLALDQDDGSLRWLRPIASSGGVRMGGVRTFARLAAYDGDVVVSSAAGAIARLEARSGRIRWLRREEVPLRAPRIPAMPWQIGGPVALDVGIATLDPAGEHWLLLDPETGEDLIRRPVGPGTVAGAVRYLLAFPDPAEGRDLLLAIGEGIVALDPSGGEEPVWTLARSIVDASDSNTLEPVSWSNGIRGRVAVVSGGVIVPSLDFLALIDGRTGGMERLIPMPGGGNPLVTRTGIFVAGDDRLVAAMPLEEAVATLRDRVRKFPDAIVQALALLELAGGLGDRALVLEAAEAAVVGLARVPDPILRVELLDRLLESVESSPDPRDGERLLELAAEVAITPEGRVRRQLALGDWMSRQGRVEDAVEAWATILESTALATVVIQADADVITTGGGVARSRVLASQRVTPSVRTWLDRRSIDLFEGMLVERGTAEDFVSVVRRFPGTQGALRAGRRAIEILRDEGRPLEAAAVARIVARDLDSGDPRLKELLRFTAAIALEADRPSLAKALDPGSTIAEADASLVGWPAVDPRTRSPRRPILGGSPRNLRLVPGVLVAESQVASLESPTDAVLVVEEEGRSLVRRSADGLSVEWRLPLAGNGVEILRYEPELLVWEGGDLRDPQLSAVDPATGALLWSTPRASSLLPAPARIAVGADGFLPDSTPFLPFEILPMPVDDGVVLARRDGSMVKIEAGDGRTVDWAREEVLDRIYDVHRAGGLLHIRGASIGVDGDTVGTVVSVDPADGRTVHQASVPGGEIRWLATDSLGRLAVGSTRSVTLIDPNEALLGGGDRWSRSDSRLLGSEIAWFDDGRLVVVDDRGVPVAFDIDLGAIDETRWNLPVDSDWIPGGAVRTVRDGTHRFLVFRDRLLLFDPEGEITGVDRIADVNRMDWEVLPTRDGVRLISQRPGRGRYTFRVFELDPEAGLRISGTPFEVEPTAARYQRAHAIDGWLLFATDREINAVPLPGNAARTNPVP